MERITRTLERTYAPREQRSEKIAVLAPHSPAVQPPVPEGVVDFTETVMFRTPIIALDPAIRDNERILPPGAGGAHGAAYKMLRTQVLRRLDQLGASTLGVMSPGAGEGKTLTAINLAIAIAADPGRTALLIDLDLRQPSIGRRFHHEPPVGIEECLQHRGSVRDAMFKVSGYERLTIAAARGRIEDSSELLASAHTAEVMAEMRARYANRVVIYDLPPVLRSDDALAFASNLQAGLLVIGERRTRRDEVTRSLQLFGDLPFVGTVLNASRERASPLY